MAISDANGSVIVSRQLDTGNVKEVCKHVVGRGLASAVFDGRCASARINIKGPVVTLQKRDRCAVLCPAMPLACCKPVVSQF